MKRLVVAETNRGERLDRFLAGHTAMSRSAIQRGLRSEQILVNGKPVRASYGLRVGDVVTFEENVPNAGPLGDLPKLTILYQDDDVLVIDKPAGVSVHPGAGVRRATIADAITAYTTDRSGERSGIVHRLDRDTSGVMIVARTPEAKSWLQDQFKRRSVEKTYLALVTGRLEPPAAVIRLPLARSAQNPLRRVPSPRGKAAETSYLVQQELGSYSLVEASPKTGRTHQLRAHFAAIGHPIAGDTRYGAPSAPVGLTRQFLHATRLAITLPNGEHRVFTVPLPDELVLVLQTLQQRV